MGMFDGFADKAKAFGSAVVGGADKVAQDIGAGFAYNSKDAENSRKADADLMAQAGKLEEKARAAKDPQESGRLHLLASQAYAQVGKNAQDTTANYSSDVGENNFARAGNAAVGVVTAADMGANPVAAIKAPIDLIKGGVNMAKNAAKFTTEDATRLMGQAKNLPGMAADYLKADAAQSFHLPSAGNSAAGDAAAAQAAGQQPQPNVPPAGQQPVPGPQFAGDQPAMPPAPDGAPSMQAQPAQPVPIPAPVSASAKKAGNPMYVQDKTTPEAIASYGSIFQVPRPVAHTFSMTEDNVINHLIKDGVTNVKSLDDVKAATDAVTGDSGAFPAINRIILQDIEKSAGPVDYSAARDAATHEVDSTLDGVKGGILNTVKRDIEKAFPNYNVPGELPSTMEENHANLTDLLDTSQRLGQLHSMYMGKAFKSTTGELNNTDYELAGQAVKEIKNNIDDIINEATKGQYQQFKEDPRIVEQLARLPGGADGPLAQRWLQNAKVFKDGQTIQVPYVNASKMVDYTKDTQLSAFTKWTNEMQEKSKSAAIAHNVTHPVQAVQKVAEKGIDKVLGPMVNKSTADLMAERTSGDSASLKQPNVSAAPDATPGNMFTNGALPFAAQVGLNGPNGTYSTNGTVVNSGGNGPDNQDSHTIGGNIAQFDPNVNTIDKLPQNPSDLHTNPDGTASIANLYGMKDKNGAQLFMDPDSIKNKQLEINKDKATEAYRYGDPATILRVDKMQQDLDATQKFSETIKDSYPTALKVNNAYSRAIVDMQGASKSILNYNGKFDDFIKQVSQDNANLATQLQVIEKAGGINPNAQIKGSTLLGALQTAQQQDLMGFYSTVSSAVGYTGGQKAPPSPVQATVPAQPTDGGGPLFSPTFDNGQSAFAAQ